MDEQSIQPVFRRGFLEDFLNSLATLPADPLCPDFEVRLFTAGPTPITPASVAADFTEATFSGYAASVVDYNPIAVNTPNNAAIGLLAVTSFVRNSSAGSDNTILGYYVCESTGHTLVFSEYFPAPVTIAAVGDYVALEVILPLLLAPQIVDV